MNDHFKKTMEVKSIFNDVAQAVEFEHSKGIGTKLPPGHTLDQRIEELKLLALGYQNEPETAQYILNKMNHFDLEMTNDQYQILHTTLFDMANKTKPLHSK